jgi:hypothetical protein
MRKSVNLDSWWKHIFFLLVLNVLQKEVWFKSKVVFLFFKKKR